MSLQSFEKCSSKVSKHQLNSLKILYTLTDYKACLHETKRKVIINSQMVTIDESIKIIQITTMILSNSEIYWIIFSLPACA